MIFELSYQKLLVCRGNHIRTKGDNRKTGNNWFGSASNEKVTLLKIDQYFEVVVEILDIL